MKIIYKDREGNIPKGPEIEKAIKRLLASNIQKTSCGDWHLGWGYGGNDKVGTLNRTGLNTFVWKGCSNGRHGQKWNHGAYVEIEIED